MSKRSKLILTLNAFDKAISTPTIKEVTRQALLFFQEHFHIDRITITLFNSDQTALDIYTLDDSIPELSHNTPLPLDPADCKQLSLQTTLRYCVDLATQKELSFVETILVKAGIHACSYIPLLLDEEVVGSVNLDSRQIDGISKTDREFFTLLSSRLALALYQARLHDTLKTKEQELARSRNDYRELIDQAGDAILKGTAKGDIIQANNAATSLFGYSQSDLLSMNISKLFTEAVLQEKPLRYDLLQKGKTVILERIIQRKDGSTFPVEMNSKTLLSRYKSHKFSWLQECTL